MQKSPSPHWQGAVLPLVLRMMFRQLRCVIGQEEDPLKPDAAAVVASKRRSKTGILRGTFFVCEREKGAGG